jgi:membrane protease YdiL (CAAX protease family)
MLPSKNWRADAVLAFLFALMMSLAVGSFAAALSAPAGSQHNSVDFRGIILATLSFQGAALVLVHLFLRAHGQTWRSGFGLEFHGIGRAISQGLTLTLVVLPVAYGLQWLSQLALQRMGIKAELQSSVELLLHSGSWPQKMYLFVFATTIAPVAEESVFRGILLPFLRDLGWRHTSIWGTGLLFGLMHGNMAAFVPLTVFGWLLAWLYVRTGNLAAPILAHSFFNLTPFILMALGLEPQS